jgi:hypothetical protein
MGAALMVAATGFAGEETSRDDTKHTPTNGENATPVAGQDGATSTLFVMGQNMGLVGFDRASTLNGSRVVVTTDLVLNGKTVSQPKDVALDQHGALYLVSGANRGSIAVYRNPLTANGSRRPDRMVYGDQTRLARTATSIAIDGKNGLLYVANTATEVLVFDISSPEAFTGNVAPARVFIVDMAQFRTKQLHFAQDALYIVDARGGTSDIVVFDDPGALRGKVTPTRMISHPTFDNKISVNVDARNRLLVGVRKRGQVLIFNNASALDGTATPDVALSISGTNVAPKPSFATTDSEDRLYVADASGNVVFSFDNVSELATGEHYPNRTIDSSSLIAPSRLLLYEY